MYISIPTFCLGYHLDLNIRFFFIQLNSVSESVQTLEYRYVQYLALNTFIEMILFYFVNELFRERIKKKRGFKDKNKIHR